MFKTLKSKLILMILTILIPLSAFGIIVHAAELKFYFNGDSGLNGGATVSGDPWSGASWYSPGQARTGWIISIADKNGNNGYAPYIYIDMKEPVQGVNLKNYNGEDIYKWINYGYAVSRLGGYYRFEPYWDEYGFMTEGENQMSAIIWAEGNCPWPRPFNNDYSSNVQAVRDWMLAEDSDINGVKVSNAEWVIRYYFGNDVYTDVLADPENFYLVLEPCATTQVPYGKDMERDQIFCASAYGWGQVLDLLQAISGGSRQEDYYKIEEYGQITGAGRGIDWVTNKSLPLSCFLAEQWDGLPSPVNLASDVSRWGTISIDTLKNRNLSYGMLALKISDLGENKETHTWDDTNYPTQPEKAPEAPNDATTEEKIYTIVKTYRQVTKDSTGRETFTHKGTYVRKDTVGKVKVEDEDHGSLEYKVVTWATSDALNSSITSNNWVNSIPGSWGASGFGETTVGLTPTHRYLYVLLETDGTTSSSTQTWDKTTYPDRPGKPPVAPSTATTEEKKYTIIKSYRDKITNTGTGVVTYNDKGTYTRTNTVPNIKIMDEDHGTTEYKVIGWKTSSSSNTSISSLNWESSVPASIGRTGTSDTTVTLDTGHRYLYVLLESDNSVTSSSTHYTIPESQITKFISLNNDESGSLTKLSTKLFKWSSLAHNTTCPGHNHCGECIHSCGSECCDIDDSCRGDATNCHLVCLTCGNIGNISSASTIIHSIGCDENVVEDHNCHSHDGWNCNTNDCQHKNCTYIDNNTPGCSEWQWDKAYCTFGTFGATGGDVTFGLWHSSTGSYPDIVSSKTDWNKVTADSLASLAKRTVSWTRTSTGTSPVPSATAFDLKTVIHRGKDKLTVAKWKNDLSGILGNVSSTSYAVANTDSGTRLTGDYTDSFSVTIDDQTDDNETHYSVTSKASCNVCHGEWDCSNSKYYSLVSAQSIGGVRVEVEVYSGSPTGGTLNINCDNSEMHIGQTASWIVSGRMIPSGDLTVRPYIQMRYDNYSATNQTAYVLGEYDRKFRFNSYAEIGWTRSAGANLELSSLQWSTHAEANKDHGIGTVLPGGATLTLTMTRGAEQQVNVITYQPVLMGAGLEHVTNTNGVSTLKTQAQAESAHVAFVNSVIAGLSNIKVEQWWVDKDLVTSTDNVWDEGGQAVDHGVGLPSGNSCSTESKYYFSNERGVPSSGLLDVVEGGTNYNYYTFWADPAGNIRMVVNNPDAPGSDPYYGGADSIVLTRGATSIIGTKAREINDKTYVITKLRDGLEQGTGDDPSANINAGGWITGNDGRWYNEAFDGITYIEARTSLTLGFIKPKERMTVLDPKLCPSSSGQNAMYSEFYTAQFKMNNGTVGGTSLLAGTFEGVGIYMHNIDRLYWSDKFYIPNANTQDLR